MNAFDLFAMRVLALHQAFPTETPEQLAQRGYQVDNVRLVFARFNLKPTTTPKPE